MDNWLIGTIVFMILGMLGISQNAYAYIDPGSGSIVIQMMIGVLVGVGITTKIYWYKLKQYFSIKKC